MWDSHPLPATICAVHFLHCSTSKRASRLLILAKSLRIWHTGTQESMLLSDFLLSKSNL